MKSTPTYSAPAGGESPRPKNDMVVPPVIYHADLCAGSGMLGLAVKLALGGRVRTVVYVEREAYAASALVARMADAALDNAPVWDDVKSLCDPEFLGYIRRFHPLVVTAGYPCQPFSVAGKRLGINDDRHIWPWIDAFIGAAKPECVFFENVPGHIRLGFGTVRRDLHRRGYRVAAGLFSAEEVGASHRRERLFILGMADSAFGGLGSVRQSSERREQPDGRHCTLANPFCEGREGRQNVRRGASETQAAPGFEFQSGYRSQTMGNAARGKNHCGAGGTLEQATSQGQRIHAAARNAGHDVAHAEERGSRACRALSKGKGATPEGTVCDGEQLAHADGRNKNALGAGRHTTPSNSVPMADACGTGLERAERTGSHGEWNWTEASGPAAEFRPPLFAPNPGNLDAWRQALANDPSLEPAVCRMADGLATGMVGDRLRLTGNGVVPLAAGYAFVSLCAALLDE